MPRKTAGEPIFDVAGGHGFNEAAARCRGKPCYGIPAPLSGIGGFNEAAARCRGKPRNCYTLIAGQRRRLQ